MVGNLKKVYKKKKNRSVKTKIRVLPPPKKKMLGNLRDKVTRKKRQISFGLTFVNKDKEMSIKK